MRSHQAQRYIVIGAGISGLTAAIQLRRKLPQAEVELWEASEQAGGLLAPIDFCGVPCDRGSHRVHPQADPLLLELTQQQQWQQRERKGRLIFNKCQLDYPPKLLPFLQGLGPKTVFEMGAGFLTRPKALQGFLRWEQDRAEANADDVGFEEFVVSRVGRSACETFYAPYVEKVWGMEPSALSQTVAKQRVSISSPLQIFAKALWHRTKQQQKFFLYPKMGMASLIDGLRQQAQSWGVSFHYNKHVEASHLQTIDANALLFSGHLSDIAPSYALEHRGLYLLHLTFPKGSVGPADTYYAPNAEFWFGRVSQPAQFSSDFELQEKDLLCVEIPEGRWGTQKDFLQHLQELQKQLATAGILRPGAPILDAKQTWLPRVYPLYRRGWLQRWQQAMQEVAKHQRIWPIGRQGLFLHCNLDHCVRIAQDAVEQLAAGKSAQTWVQQAKRYLDLRVRD